MQFVVTCSTDEVFVDLYMSFQSFCWAIQIFVWVTSKHFVVDEARPCNFQVTRWTQQLHLVIICGTYLFRSSRIRITLIKRRKKKRLLKILEFPQRRKFVDCRFAAQERRRLIQRPKGPNLLGRQKPNTRWIDLCQGLNLKAHKYEYFSSKLAISLRLKIRKFLCFLWAWLVLGPPDTTEM